MDEVKVSLSEEEVRFNNTAAVTRFGLIVLATDQTLEGDINRLLRVDNVAIHAVRVAFENPTTPENLRKMEPRLTEAARLLAPAGPLQAVYYGCTSASVVIGDQNISSAIEKSLPGVPVITPTFAARQAFGAFGVSKIAVLTPYTVATSEPMAAYFTSHGVEIVRFDCLGIKDDRDMARTSDTTIIKAAIAADHPDAQALFISCTALPVAGLISDIEKRLGKPVITSNQASAWAMARTGGMVDHSPVEFGSLYSLQLPVMGAGEAA